MEAYSGLLLKLYRQAQIIPPTEFQTRALDAAREALAFDSALWARGAMESQGGTVHSACVYCQPPGMMESYERGDLGSGVDFFAGINSTPYI